MTASFKNGLELKSKHGDFRAAHRRPQKFDGVWLEQNCTFYEGRAASAMRTRSNFRHARLLTAPCMK